MPPSGVASSPEGRRHGMGRSPGSR